jgi:DNA-binding beta-propeller fold protein YncE
MRKCTDMDKHRICFYKNKITYLFSSKITLHDNLLLMSNFAIRTKIFTALWLTLFFVFAPKVLYAFENVDFLFNITSGLQDPVDTGITKDGDIVVLDRKASKVYVFDSAGTKIREFGTNGSQRGQLSRPQSIALTSNDEIVVADTGNNRIQVFGIEGNFLFAFGNSGMRRGEFKRPVAVAVDQSDFILVADADNKRIQVFSPRGIYRFYMPLTSSPTDIAIDRKNNVHVLLSGEGKIAKTRLAKRNKPFEFFACNYNQKNYTQEAVGMAVDYRGDVYITENDEHSIKKIDDKGKVLLSFGSEGDGRGQFDRPNGITADQEGNIYVADSRNKRVQVLNIAGSDKKEMNIWYSNITNIDYDSQLPTEDHIVDVSVNKNGEVFVLSEKGHVIVQSHGNKIIGSVGRGDGQLRSPKALYAANDGKVYVADTGNNRVVVFNEGGKFEFKFGKRGQKTGQFRSPAGIVVNKKGIIYVSDTRNHRVQIFNEDGIFLSAFGKDSQTSNNSVAANGTFSTPKALALDSKENVYVVDQGNNRIQVFDENGQFIKTFGRLGKLYGQFNKPVDIALNENDIGFVTEELNNRVQVFNIENEKVAFGSAAKGYGQFTEIAGVDFYHGNIYLTDTRHNQIRLYSFEQKFEKREKKEVKQVPIKTVPKAKKQEEVSDEGGFELK